MLVLKIKSKSNLIFRSQKNRSEVSKLLSVKRPKKVIFFLKECMASRWYKIIICDESNRTGPILDQDCCIAKPKLYFGSL